MPFLYNSEYDQDDGDAGKRSLGEAVQPLGGGPGAVQLPEVQRQAYGASAASVDVPGPYRSDPPSTRTTLPHPCPRFDRYA